MSWELKTSFIFGVLHSLEPGHGKTAMLALMLDQRKKWLDAFLLALSAVFSHSALMLIIALITHFGSHLILGENSDHFLHERLEVLGPTLLTIIGSFLLMRSHKTKKKCCGDHPKETKGSSRVPILLGISIGLYPCPTLIATYVSSVSNGQLSLGIAAVGVFALGSFVSILLAAFTMKFIGQRLVGKMKLTSSQLNWSRIQGFLILFIGILGFFSHN